MHIALHSSFVRIERQSARMSKNKNGGLDHSVALNTLMCDHLAALGLKGLNCSAATTAATVTPS